MSPHFPIEDPSERSSFVEQSTAYVKESPLLRVAFLVTAADLLAAGGLAMAGKMAPEMTGFLVLISALAWFFAVGVPIMNREVRARLGDERSAYWGEVVEMFARVALSAQTVLFTAVVVFAMLQ